MHKPVLLKEVLEYLDPKPGQNFIDCTFGRGGHSFEILKRIEPEGKLLGIDQDPGIKKLNNNKNLILVNNNFRNLKQIYEHDFHYPVSGILCDLGLSSIELDKSGLGFSFMRDEPLDMRFNPESQRLTAAEALNKYSRNKLAEIFKDYGEVPDKKAKLIALEIIKKRGRNRFERTGDLLEIIGEKKKYDRIHPATLFFQALRIEVNDELNALRELLPQAIGILEPEGKLAVISFHSLEDRIVKRYFKSLDNIEILTKKPVVPGENEIKGNSRSRSAKLRVCQKLSENL